MNTVLFECFVLLSFRLTPQGVGIAKGNDVDGLHQTVAHPELNVGLDGVAAAGGLPSLLGMAGRGGRHVGSAYS